LVCRQFHSIHPEPMLPLRRFQMPAPSHALVTELATASRGVDCAAECCECRCTWAVGLPRSRTYVSSFPTDRGGLPPTPYLASCDANASSRALRSPSEFHRAVSRMNRSRVRAPPLGFASLMTTSTRGVHNSPGIPRPTMFRPQRFARSRRLTPPRALRACFIALPCPGFSLQGLLPPFEPHHLVGGRYPRAVGVARLPVARRQRTSRRPQGLALVRSPLCPRGG
jgi:hypothetical protein